MTITNNGSGAGEVLFGPGLDPVYVVDEYFDANLNGPLYFSADQTLAVAAPVPEPGTLLLLGAGLGGLAVVVRTRRPRMT